MTTAEFALASRPDSDRRSPVRWLVWHIRRHQALVAGMLLGAFGNAALTAAVPVLIGQAVNRLSTDTPDMRAVGLLALWIAASQALRGVLQLARNFGAELIGQRLERDIREELYLSLLGKSMTFHNLQPVGDTMARATNDVREINFLFSPGINLVVGSANFILVPVLLAPSYHPSLILVPLLFVAGYGFALWQYLRELGPISDRVRRSFGGLNAHLAEAIDGIEVVKAHAQEAQEVARFDANAREFRDAFVQQGDVEARFLPLLLLGLAEAGALLHALLLFNRGALDVGQVVAYVGLIQLFGFPTFVSLFAYSQVSLGLASARRILDLINRRTELDENPQGVEAEMRGEVEFRDVDFAYAGRPTLRGVSFRIPPGSTVAIVGQTGSGKSSLIKLINRIHDVSRGAVLVDGIDTRQWSLAALRRQVSTIEQDVFLFSRTIAENIAFGRPGATPEAIEQAARAAQAHEFILALPSGYQTVIGERGVTLSGGQRQRLALARAFLTDPRILILDDSTSSVDSATEDQIQRAIFRAAQGRTTFLVTHRLSQIRWADTILVLRRGRLVDCGTHEQLLQTSESYRRIFPDEEARQD